MRCEDRWLSWAQELQALAQAGLFYTKDIYDAERFQRIREISAEMVAEASGLPLERVTDLFCGESGYQTPKIDTRAAIVEDGRILLVRENNGQWSLPGGWCDVGLSPAENAVKEVREEAGLTAKVEKVIAVQDRDRHNLPRYAYSITKIFFLCTATGGAFQANSETTESGWFAPDALPPLAGEKTTEEQIHMCFAAALDAHWQTVFD